MGKRSRNHMTGLSPDGRVKRSVKRKAEEEQRRIEERVKMAKAMLGLPLQRKNRVNKRTLTWARKPSE